MMGWMKHSLLERQGKTNGTCWILIFILVVCNLITFAGCKKDKIYIKTNEKPIEIERLED